MTLGRTSTGAIKIKTDSPGLRAVECACCATPFGLLASATSDGQGLGCAMGPVIQNIIIPPPYRLQRGTTYRFRIEFNSGDGAFHVGSFYTANFSLTPSIPINWQTSYEGTAGNPWSIGANGHSITFNLEDSENCGGNNPNTQSGTALATILSPSSPITLGFSFQGIAELQDSGFENISFYLDPV
jgi:hypothetical protein